MKNEGDLRFYGFDNIRTKHYLKIKMSCYMYNYNNSIQVIYMAVTDK